MAQWDLAAVIIAIVALLLTPIILAFFRRVRYFVASVVCPDRYTKCESLTWPNIRDGVLHTCTIPQENCRHNDEISITEFFNSRRETPLVVKPLELSLTKTYVRTDARTIKAFLSMSRHSHILTFDKVGTVTKAHLKLGDTKGDEPITKVEMGRILDGYPPWYRETIVLANGDRIPHPIQDTRGLSRGGWIVAAGVSEISSVAKHSMAIHEDGGFAPLTQGLNRILHCLENLGKRPELQGPQLQVAIQTVTGLHTGFKKFDWGGSALRYIYGTMKVFSDEFGSDWYGGSTSLEEGLDTAQTQLAIQVFSQYDEPSDDQVQALKDIFGRVLAVALKGIYKIGEELDDGIDRAEWPPELMGNGHIYLFESPITWEE